MVEIDISREVRCWDVVSCWLRFPVVRNKNDHDDIEINTRTESSPSLTTISECGDGLLSMCQKRLWYANWVWCAYSTYYTNRGSQRWRTPMRQVSYQYRDLMSCQVSCHHNLGMDIDADLNIASSLFRSSFRAHKIEIHQLNKQFNEA